ncbi:hypothetical protein INR77_09005 [Erythrobacter sp. SCSIO 43205]|uniref:hypothetical protein n=1 Tax=Erythrobacter sp. SCSIO 43205 TaxID=2779361 RepID=UPI001CA86B06|nr:hypothetical protein [Erythrobacter sp. SCSIO 43205]UAB76985.1 hypothetical protein INR77_09005 [Erythrobacter sp. SCSIO 43205]
MVAIPTFTDPTLEAADRALEARQEKYHRGHLGMSQIGRPCEREIWYSFRWAQRPDFDAPILKRFEDGHRTEDLVIARLQATPGIELHDKDENGQQFRFEDFGGHFSGSCDGAILGLIQAPKTWHVYEGKCSAKWQELDKAKRKVGEKAALAEWNPAYYAQGVLYMHYSGMDRHYLVCSSPGGRNETSVRTEADPVAAQVLRDKAERIIFTDTAPQRIGGPDFYQCKWCDFRALCHEGVSADGQVLAERNCRTCLNVTPERDGTWRCTKFGHALSKDDQRAGCPLHRFLPSLVPWDQIDTRGEDVIYARPNEEWVDRGPEVAGCAL